MSVEIGGLPSEGRLVVDGWTVPLISATKAEDGVVCLTLDGRFGISVPADYVEPTCWFVANCIAVALGLSCHPGEAEAWPLDGTPTETAKMFTLQLLQVHPGLRPRRRVCITDTVTAPIGPRRLEPE